MGRILYAEDDDAMRSMVTDMLVAAGHSVEPVRDGVAALAAIRRDPPDMVVLDYRMGDPDGFEVCRRVKADPASAHVPVLLLTGEAAVENRIQGFSAGANDYLPKPFDGRELVARVNALLRLSDQGRGLNPTTGLPGGTVIEREIERRRLKGTPFTLCYLDLDNFKSFNDRFGFAKANTVIESVGRILREAVAGTDYFAGHIGGDDFIVICDRAASREMMERVRRSLGSTLGRLLPAEVMERGSYYGRKRSGSMGEIPITRLSAGLLHLDPAKMPPFSEIGEAAADAKQQAKERESDGIVEVEVEAVA